jgi:hypothetical protein
MDDPPKLEPHEKPDPEELCRLALRLLRELAQHDPDLAARMQALGIEVED